MANVTRAVGLTLDEDSYAQLEDFARAHHWKVAQAARVIIMERLSAENNFPGQDAMGTGSLFRPGGDER